MRTQSGLGRDPGGHRTGFSKARNKLKPEVFESLNQALQHQIDSLGLRQTWRGLRVLAVDGSSVHLPLELAMTRSFGSHCELPVARLSMLYDVADGQTLHSLIVIPELGERDCAHLHLIMCPLALTAGTPGTGCSRCLSNNSGIS